MTQEETDFYAKKIWDYMHMNQPLQKADCLLVMCSNDPRVAEYAAQLWREGWAPCMVISGYLSPTTEALYHRPEAEFFAEIAKKKGVPADKIFIENKSRNTGENVLFTEELLRERGADPKSFIVVQKPYMERRAYATFKKLWPQKDFIVTSPPILFEDYTNDGTVSREQFLDMMVGDLQRIKVYPDKGYQIPQEIPPDVWDAYEKLVAAGFTKHLVLEQH